MSTVIGGPFRCNIHEDFGETDDVNVWNEHCSTTEGHGTTGAVPCISCGKSIDLGIIPYQPIGKETRLQCQECFGQSQDLNKLVLDQQKQLQEGGEQQ